MKKEEPKASFFYIAYIKEGVEENSTRPITFCFNGGPGSSAIWLQMGAFGPKRVLFDSEGYSQPPYKYIDNEYCLLDETDLVFIDPISTGYSRPVAFDQAKQFHGVDEDIKSVAEFIRLYITRFNRWDSPKFLAGESYGTTRAAGLACYLHDECYVYINGVLLVSSILNFQTIDTNNGNDLPYILYLPTYTAAAAWYHKKLAPELQNNFERSLRESQEFALNEYAWALLQGDQLEPEKRKETVKKLSFYTGLSESYIERSNLRVCMSRFNKELLRDQNKVIGRFDCRYLGLDEPACSDTVNSDPSWDAVFGAFTSTFNTYVRTDLKWEKDTEYKVLADVFPWNYGKGANNKYLNVSATLRDVMTKNPAIRVFVASGYYDLATPYFATIYTFNHLGLNPSLKDHVKMGFYDAGHMMYINPPSLKQFKKDIADFMKDTLSK